MDESQECLKRLLLLMPPDEREYNFKNHPCLSSFVPLHHHDDCCLPICHRRNSRTLFPSRNNNNHNRNHVLTTERTTTPRSVSIPRGAGVPRRFPPRCRPLLRGSNIEVHIFILVCKILVVYFLAVSAFKYAYIYQDEELAGLHNKSFHDFFQSNPYISYSDRKLYFPKFWRFYDLLYNHNDQPLIIPAVPQNGGGAAGAGTGTTAGGGHKSTMLLGIFSTLSEKCTQRRSLIRETYLSTNDPRVCTLNEYKRQVHDDPNNVVCQVAYTFVIGAGDSSRPRDHDDKEPLTVFDTPPAADVAATDMTPKVGDGTISTSRGTFNIENDCTYLNIQENMNDGKSPTYFKFGANLSASYQQQIDYIAKIDDDSILSLPLLIDFLDQDLPPSPYNKRHYGGTVWGSYEKNIILPFGEFYFMSSDLANYVGNVLSSAQRRSMMHARHTEDADMASFVFSHPRPVKFITMSTYTIWHHPRKKAPDFRRTFDETMHMLPKVCHYQFPMHRLCKGWLNGELMI